MENQQKIDLTVNEEESGLRLDKYLSSKIADKSRSAIAGIIESKLVTCNGKTLPKSYKVKYKDKLQLIIPKLRELEILAEDIPLDIVYEDEFLLVVNKPKGMVVHPAPGNYYGTLVNALMHHCKGKLSGINGVIRPGIVHRLDKDTSGLLIVAKNDIAHNHLAKQIKDHSFKRMYEAVVHNNIKYDKGVIDLPIGRHPVYRKKMAVTYKNSRQAITEYEVIARYCGYTHIRLYLKTGRTHQIRVHMANMGNPVAGDLVYGPKKPAPKLNGQCLHAKLIGFIHPFSNEYIEFESKLPEYFKMFLASLGDKH